MFDTHFSLPNRQPPDDELAKAMLAAFGDDAADWLDQIDDDRSIEPATDELDRSADLDTSTDPHTSADGTVVPCRHPRAGGDPAREEHSEADVVQGLQDLLQKLSTEVQRDQTNDSQEFSKGSLLQVGVRYVVFEVGNQQFGIPLAGVREIDRCGKVTALPRTPAWLRGVTNLRGQILSVTDFRNLLQLSEDGRRSVGEKIIVVHSQRHDARTALVVDRVLGIRNLQGEQTSLQGLPDRIADFAVGIVVSGQSTTVLIDPDHLLGCNEMASFASE